MASAFRRETSVPIPVSAEIAGLSSAAIFQANGSMIRAISSLPGISCWRWRTWRIKSQSDVDIMTFFMPWSVAAALQSYSVLGLSWSSAVQSAPSRRLDHFPAIPFGGVLRHLKKRSVGCRRENTARRSDSASPDHAVGTYASFRVRWRPTERHRANVAHHRPPWGWRISRTASTIIAAHFCAWKASASECFQITPSATRAMSLRRSASPPV